MKTKRICYAWLVVLPTISRRIFAVSADIISVWDTGRAAHAA